MAKWLYIYIYIYIQLITLKQIFGHDIMQVIAQEYEHGMFTSQCLNLSTDPSNISAVMSQVVTNETEDADLVCEAFGIPTPNVTWRDGSGSIIEPGGRLTISNSLNQSVVVSTLAISRVQESNEMIYTCLAENGVTNLVGAQDTATVELIIRGEKN